MLFEIDYIRADEPEKNYQRILPQKLFIDLYPGFGFVFAARAKSFDSMAVCLGLERWVVNVKEGD